jgi:hypothetical protein
VRRTFQTVYLERLTGKSERVQNRGSDGRREGAKGARPATFWRQEHAIKEPSAIFQTVSLERLFEKVRRQGDDVRSDA